jgi:hypothetical protein
MPLTFGVGLGIGEDWCLGNKGAEGPSSCQFFTTSVAINSFATGATAGGMLVTATFTDLTAEAVAWVSDGLGAGHVTGTGWTISISGDTSLNHWTLANTRGVGMTSLAFDGKPGFTLFDRTLPSPGTNGSSTGKDFAVFSGGMGGDVITAAYSGPIALVGAVPVGDIYRYMTVSFSMAGGLASGRTLVYDADTDLLGDALACVSPGTAQTRSQEDATLRTLEDGTTRLMDY